MNKHLTLTLIGCWLLSTQVGAEDLLAVMQQAEVNDPVFREAQANTLAIQEGIPQARAEAWLPELSFSAGASRVQQSIVLDAAIGSGGDVAFDTRRYRVDLVQPVYHHDRWLRIGQANKRLLQSEYELEAAKQSLVTRTAERYFEVLAAQDNLEFAQAEKESLKGQLEQAQQRFDVGLIAVTDVQEAQAGYDRATANEIQARNQLDIRHEELREITGNYYEELSSLEQEFPLTPPSPADIESWANKAIEQNLEIAAAQTASEIAHEEIRIQYAGHFPTFEIRGGHGFNDQGGRFGATQITQGDIGMEINLPIYQGGRVVSQTREAKHSHQAALERLEQARRAAYRQTRQAYLGVMTQISTVKAFKQAVVSSTTALESTRAGFQVGTRTAVDVVDAERGLFQAKRDYARARYDYILEILRLKEATGSLSPEDLVTTNSWLVSK
ncbi:MAG: TolC family outer membrane protein [Gammaproteobacteria bacterium]